MLFKVSKTAKSRHIGTYHYDMINATYAKESAGGDYHIYRKDTTRTTGSGGTKWVLVRK